MLLLIICCCSCLVAEVAISDIRDGDGRRRRNRRNRSNRGVVLYFFGGLHLG